MADLLVLAGLGLLGVALWLVWSWPAVLAYAGVVLIVLAVVMQREVTA
jgi:hypothetical protein